MDEQGGRQGRMEKTGGGLCPKMDRRRLNRLMDGLNSDRLRKTNLILTGIARNKNEKEYIIHYTNHLR